MLPLSSPTTSDHIQGRLLNLAALFLVLYALALTLSPAVHARSWQVDYRWSHWLGLSLWLLIFNLAHLQSAHWLPDRDPYLLPIVALLSGWGIMTVSRLLPTFGLRQGLWLGIAVGILILGMRLPSDLRFLRRYKYLWLTSSLLLTALTLLFGTNPLGYGPRMWLGCCGVYLQPSEPLKLMLVAYLAAYLADQPFLAVPGSDASLTARKAANTSSSKSLLSSDSPVNLHPSTSTPLLPLLAPTLIMTGLALALLLVQRDLGTAFIFLFLYASVVYVTSGRRRVLGVTILALVAAGIAGYLLFDVVRVRVDGWLNPWADPSGRSYQIVQSLLAVANGGLLGRGPGLGNPGLVPLAHSDFIYASLAEEVGLIGAVALLLLIAFLASRGLRTALYAADAYRRYLAAGLTALIVGQSVLIIGGNLRLFPLTGITLPFVSYGGSSLVTSFIAILLLLHIGNRAGMGSATLPLPYTYRQLGAVLFGGLAIAGLATGWWGVYRGPDLVTRTDNPRRAIADRSVRRGSVLDRRNEPINASFGRPGEYLRQTLYPDLSNVVGYTHPVYGQSGIEAAMDDYLRGLEGNPSMTIWWNHLLYGQPPPGLDVRLSLDQDLQRVADELMQGSKGALVLLDAQGGEILAMASHPTFNANRLDEDWESLIEDPDTPLINRAAQGLYPPGAALGPLLLAEVNAQGVLPSPPLERSYSLDGRTIQCAVSPPMDTWVAVIASGCPGPVAALGQSLGPEALLVLYQSLGFYTAPPLPLPVGISAPATTIPNAARAALGVGLQVSPLQMSLAAATLSAGGLRPVPHLVSGVNTPQAGWVVLPSSGEPAPALLSAAASVTAGDLTVKEMPYWESVATAPYEHDEAITWYLGGTSPDWEGTPLALALLVEENNPDLALQIGRAMLRAAMGMPNLALSCIDQPFFRHKSNEPSTAPLTIKTIAKPDTQVSE